MASLRAIWRSARHATAPIRHRLGALRDQRRVQRTAPLAPEDRAYKRRRRHVLVDLLNEHCPGEGLRVAEIGTCFGETGAHLIRYCPRIERLFAVDLRSPPPDSPIWGLERHEFIKGYSDQSAARFEDESFDLVFIDADHSASAVLADLKAWVPKVKPGRVIAGHDYGSHTHPDVKPVVDAFFKDHPHPLHIETNRVFWTLK